MFCVRPTKENEALKGSRFFAGPRLHALIAAGGVESQPQQAKEHLGPLDLVLAADGGYRLLQAMNLPCDILVGDFDTLSQSEVTLATNSGVRVERFPADKAKSDLEIAIDTAFEAGVTEITFLGALGGDWDHSVVNLLAPLSLCAEYGMWARLLTSSAQIYLLQGSVEIIAPGRRVSLAALSAEVRGLRISGMAYPLQDATLRRAQTLGLANRVIQQDADVSFDSGEVLLTVLH